VARGGSNTKTLIPVMFAVCVCSVDANTTLQCEGDIQRDGTGNASSIAMMGSDDEHSVYELHWSDCTPDGHGNTGSEGGADDD
jgi:hypothetical protein